MLSEPCGSSLFLSLSDDVFALVSRSLSPTDVCTLSLCCKSLCALVESEKVWLTQCDVVGILPYRDLVQWRKGVSSYKALCRFLICVRPLIGIWVHQNPELGNVVYVMPGFVSVIGCRIIPQELGPLGIEDGPILWAPVFEIIGDFDGCCTFLLHGRENNKDYIYPGSVNIDKACNVMFLEVEPRKSRNGSKLLQSKSFGHYSVRELRVRSSESGLSRSQRVAGRNEGVVSFNKLAFSDRRKLLDIVTSEVRQQVPDEAIGPFFPRLTDNEDHFQKDLVLLEKRRSFLTQMARLSRGHAVTANPLHLELPVGRKSLDCSRGLSHLVIDQDNSCHAKCTKKSSLGAYFRNSIKQIFGKSNSVNGRHGISKINTSSSESRHAQLHDFLSSGDTIRLSLRASTIRLSSYRAWPNMHESWFALYKLPMRAPSADKEYAGLWGGTFGWPPGKPTEDKPGKALFFLLLSYEESQQQRHLIATKILEGTHYVLHPNGSAMFIVNINEPSLDPFPWDTDADSAAVNIKHAFMGEGIANGYGFRYPGLKPGSLFVFNSGLLAFIWKESRAVLTLQRINVQELLKKGERVPALPPIANFSYLTKSYSNVFAGFPNILAHVGIAAPSIL